MQRVAALSIRFSRASLVSNCNKLYNLNMFLYRFPHSFTKLRCHLNRIAQRCSYFKSNPSKSDLNAFSRFYFSLHPKKTHFIWKTCYRKYTTSSDETIQSSPISQTNVDTKLQQLRDDIIQGKKVNENEIISLIIECGNEGKIQQAEQVLYSSHN